MTEKEAKSKWCPMRKAESSGFDKIFGPMSSNESARCIGSACMMWRMEKQSQRAGYDSEGYCGLAGRL